jgi:endoglycosylceramidase
MQASAYIGRVGGLAVALGIGVALASGTGTASADTGSSTSNHSAGAAAPGHAGGTAARRAAKPGTDKAAKPATTQTSSAAVSTPAAARVTAVRGSAAGNTPAAPADSPVSWTMLAATRRETIGAASKGTTSGAPALANTATPPNLTSLFQQVVFTPVHSLAEGWIHSDLGQQVDGVVNTLTGRYLIGDGAPGTEMHANGGAGGWLFGDGGDGWNSTEAGIAGGSGGSAGLFGVGGAGGSGGTDAAGGSGGRGGRLMGIGGSGGEGGAAVDGDTGGAGGAGGRATGLLFGIGGHGGDGGDGPNGGRGGTGGTGTFYLGSGGDGGDAGTSGVGGDPVGLPALGGAGGNAGLLGSHGKAGDFSKLPDGSLIGGTQPATGSLPALSNTGTWITNSAGQVVLMHGANEVYKVAPYEPSASGFNEEDAAFLAANGFNVVRLGVIWSAVEPEPGVYDTDYLDSINATVQMLADHGIYTIVDMHQDNYSEAFQGEGAPAWATRDGGLPNPKQGFPGNYFLNPAEWHAWDSFWGNAPASNGLGLEDNYAQSWETIASYFSGNSAVIGYDIMNEPFPGSSWVSTLLGSQFFGQQQLSPMYNQVAAAIRAVDPNTSLYIEPANPAVTEVGAILGAPISLGTIKDPNTVLTYHGYCGPFGGGLCVLIADQLTSQAVKYGAQHNVPAFMDEFGATNDTAQLLTEMRPADRNLVGWAVWAYTGQGDITTSGDRNAEALVYDPLLPPTGDNVNTSNLATMAAPYPQVISGTPKSWSFTNGVFNFSYSTEKADGSGSFDAGSQTIISVPVVEFPNGYQVTVTGGHVVSLANAPQLVVVSDDGAAAVSVVVNPTVDPS